MFGAAPDEVRQAATQALGTVLYKVQLPQNLEKACNLYVVSEISCSSGTCANSHGSPTIVPRQAASVFERVAIQNN